MQGSNSQEASSLDPNWPFLKAWTCLEFDESSNKARDIRGQFHGNTNTVMRNTYVMGFGLVTCYG